VTRRLRQTLAVAEWELRRCFSWWHWLLAGTAVALEVLLDDRWRTWRITGVVVAGTALGTFLLLEGIRAERRDQVAEMMASAVSARTLLAGKALGTALYILLWLSVASYPAF